MRAGVTPSCVIACTPKAGPKVIGSWVHCKQGIVCNNWGKDPVTAHIDREARDLELGFERRSGDLSFTSS